MKTSRSHLYLSFCYCLVASSNALVPLLSRLVSPSTTYASYEDAKKDFEAKGKIQKLDHEQAKSWFSKNGYGEEFDDYFEARDFFEKKGYLKKIAKLYDGSGQFSFVRDGEEVDKTTFHDVIVSLFLSDFIYCLGTLRQQTKSLAFTDEGLKEEVVLGSSFDKSLFNKEEQDIIKSNEDEKGKAFDPKSPIVKLMQGNLKVSKDPNIKTPEVSMSQFQDVLRYKGFKDVSKRFASELTVTALHSFKTNKLFIHKFDAKYNNKNLVYSIAGRERKNGQNADENETDLFLSFRGSVTTRDWIQNVQAPLIDLLLRKDEHSGKCFIIEQLTFQKIEIEPSLYDQLQGVVDEAGYPIRVHQGFLEYLFADRGRNGEVDDDKDNDSMYTNIRLNVNRLLNQKVTVNNNLYVTGHSLGGALATLASFFLACEKDINNQGPDWRGVKCISFASPIVGNVSFQRAFEVLQSKQQYQSSTAKTPEGERLFKNIRVTNNRDMVPLLPFFSKYRHAAGVHVHLKRPSILSLWRPRKPSIEAKRAHWKPTLDLKRPWKIFPPTSLITGLFATTFKFIGLVATTAPIIFVVPYLLTQPFQGLFPPISAFKSFFIDTGITQNALVAAALAFTQKSMFKLGVVGLSWAAVGYLLTKKDTSTPERTALICFGLPWIYSLTKFIRDKASHQAFAATWEVQFLVGIVCAQIAMLFARKPAEVLAFKTHGLEDYYDHLRPNHPLLSSSTAIMDYVEKSLED